jgi:hypothetical protein
MLGKLETCEDRALEKQSKRAPINSGYESARILENDSILTLVPLKVKALEVPRYGL